MKRSGETDWVAKGRAEKVAAMVDVIDGVAGHLGLYPASDAEQIARVLRGLNARAWHDIQRYAGFKRSTPPSQETINAVIDRYYSRIDRGGEELAS